MMDSNPLRGYSDMLLDYSEWLDGQRLFADPEPTDKRSYDDLVNEFLEHRNKEIA
jgi:hypothetical protein